MPQRPPTNPETTAILHEAFPPMKPTTRIEVIDETGRAFSRKREGGFEWHISEQDDGATLKIFVTPRYPFEKDVPVLKAQRAGLRKFVDAYLAKFLRA